MLLDGVHAIRPCGLFAVVEVARGRSVYVVDEGVKRDRGVKSNSLKKVSA